MIAASADLRKDCTVFVLAFVEQMGPSPARHYNKACNEFSVVVQTGTSINAMISTIFDANLTHLRLLHLPTLKFAPAVVTLHGYHNNVLKKKCALAIATSLPSGKRYLPTNTCKTKSGRAQKMITPRKKIH